MNKIDWDLSEKELREQLSTFSAEEIWNEVKDIEFHDDVIDDISRLKKIVFTLTEVPELLGKIVQIVKYGRVSNCSNCSDGDVELDLRPPYVFAEIQICSDNSVRAVLEQLKFFKAKMYYKPLGDKLLSLAEAERVILSKEKEVQDLGFLVFLEEDVFCRMHILKFCDVLHVAFSELNKLSSQEFNNNKVDIDVAQYVRLMLELVSDFKILELDVKKIK